MLQILTGRFFEGKNKLEEQVTEAVLYSNYLFISNIETPVGELRRARYGTKQARAYVFRYTNRYERASEDDPMVLAHSDEAVEQFRYLCCLWFRAIFHPDRSFVESVTHPNVQRENAPAYYVDTYFSPTVEVSHEHRQDFSKFLTDVTSLPRKKYLKVIACVRAFCDSLEALATNFDVAYAQLVYLLEALCKVAEGKYEPTWDDFEEGQRLKIDEICKKMDAELADKLRARLLKNPHLKLFKRLSGFVTKTTKDSFFTDEAVGRQNAIRKSELPLLLRNLYTSRSGYVHDLEDTLEDSLRISHHASSETIRFKNNIHLTYSGLVRLARHVLISFITDSPKEDNEEVYWRSQIPGVIQAELSPELWIHRTLGFTEDHAKKKFSGVSAHFLDILKRPGGSMAPIGQVVDIIDGLLKTCKPENFPSLLSIYWLFNNCIVQSKAKAGWERIVEEGITKDETCHIEYLASAALIGGRLPHDAASCEKAYRDYTAHRHKEREVSLYPAIELAVLCYIANEYLDAGSHDDHKRILDEAIFDAPGAPDIQQQLRTHRDSQQSVPFRTVLLGQPTREAFTYEI